MLTTYLYIYIHTFSLSIYVCICTVCMYVYIYMHMVWHPHAQCQHWSGSGAKIGEAASLETPEKMRKSMGIIPFLLLILLEDPENRGFPVDLL